MNTVATIIHKQVVSGAKGNTPVQGHWVRNFVCMVRFHA